jgi:hypothetical protein
MSKVSIKTQQLLIYFAVAFAISWGGVFLAVGPSGFPGTPEQFATLLPLVVLAMLAGPSVAGLLSTGLVHGRAGLRDLRSRLLRWRVCVRRTHLEPGPWRVKDRVHVGNRWTRWQARESHHGREPGAGTATN